MTPYLVTPPAALPVSFFDMRAHLRVVHSDDDADIDAKQAGVVAILDGHGGLLGRCIMPQTWAVDVTGPGPHVLPFPDASDVTAVSDDGALGVEVSISALGPCVTVADASPSESVTITAEYALPEPRLSAARSLIKLMVQREYDVMAGPDFDAITRSIREHIGALRWRRI